MGGQDKLRPYWRHYYTGAQGIMFVIDASDQARLDLAASELQNLCQDDLLAVRSWRGGGGYERKGRASSSWGGVAAQEHEALLRDSML